MSEDGKGSQARKEEGKDTHKHTNYNSNMHGTEIY